MQNSAREFYSAFRLSQILTFAERHGEALALAQFTAFSFSLDVKSQDGKDSFTLSSPRGDESDIIIVLVGSHGGDCALSTSPSQPPFAPPIVGSLATITSMGRTESIGGTRKSPAAICKIIETKLSGTHEKICGDGTRTRSFTFVDDCLRGTQAVMESDIIEPINVGSSELVTINQLVDMV